jgi:hypothetical protein
MRKRRLFKKLSVVVSFLLLGLAAILFLTGSRGFDKKLTIIVTGELSGIFHPFGEDPDNAFLRERLDEVITKLKKSYPDAVLVDTGNYLSIPDFSETVYKSPALKHFIKHNYDVLNLGANEVMFERSINTSPFAMDNAKPHLVSLLNYRSNNKNIGLPFVDIDGDSQKSVRFLGICPLNHEYSAPHLNDTFRFNYLLDIVECPPSPGLSILLSDLPHSKNLRIAESISGVDLILESGQSEQPPVYREKDTFICHRVVPESVGLFQLKRNKQGKIDKITFKSYSLTEKKGFLGLYRKRIARSVRKPLRVIGKMAEQEQYLKKLTVGYDAYEIHRHPIGEFSSKAVNDQVFFYELYQKHEPIARSFLVEHSLGKTRPYYLFFITFDLDNKVKKIDFVAPPSFLFWQMGVNGFVEKYYGQDWNKMSFDSQGCLGALDEFSALHEDISLIAQIADNFFPLKKNE